MKTRVEELKEIAEEHGGTLYPKHVVERAKNHESSLHDAFEWDNDKAGHKYRLHQARNLIRITVDVIEQDNSESKTVTAFVALQEDRENGGGYKPTVILIKTADGRKAIIQTAMWELRAFRAKYKHLSELNSLFLVISEIEEIHEKEGKVDWTKEIRKNR